MTAPGAQTSTTEEHGTGVVRVGLDALLMRSRMVLDSIIHRPPVRPAALLPSSSVCAGLLGITSSESDLLWSEVVESQLERSILRELESRIPRQSKVRRVAQPEGQWLEILRFIHVLTRAIRPVRAVETGVGPVGSTTAFILSALRINRAGHLWSIDANRYGLAYHVGIGSGVPRESLDRHTLVIGNSRRTLNRVLDICSPIDLFLHDGDHSYSNMRFEFSLAWASLRPLGYLMVDDANNSAVDEFAKDHAVEPVFLRYGPTSFAILQKTGAER